MVGWEQRSRPLTGARLRRDKASLDVFWLKAASMTDLENLPESEILAEEIMGHRARRSTVLSP